MNFNALDASANLSNYSNIIFTIENPHNIKIEELYPTFPNPWWNPVLLTTFVIVAISAMLTICALAHKKQKLCLFEENVMDDAQWIVFMIFSLQIVDFVSDISFAMEIMNSDRFNSEWNVKKDLVIKISGILSWVFISVPYFVNLFFAVKIKQKIPKDNKIAFSYFNTYANIFVFLVICCGGCYPSLVMVSSAVFGLKQLNSGLTVHDLKQMNKIKVITGVWLENVPQLMIQFMYTISIGSISPNTTLSFIASVLSILAVLTAYLIEKSDGNFITFTYYIEIQKNIPLTDEEKKTFSKTKGKTMCLSRKICQGFGCQQKDIEISKNSDITDFGIRFYVNHHVIINNTNIFNIGKEYEKEAMNNKFREHFEVNEDFMIVFKQNMDGIGNDTDLNTLHFIDSMKTLMQEKDLDFHSEHAKQIFFSNLFDTNDENTTETKDEQHMKILSETTDESVKQKTNHDEIEMHVLLNEPSKETHLTKT